MMKNHKEKHVMQKHKGNAPGKPYGKKNIRKNRRKNNKEQRP